MIVWMRTLAGSMALNLQTFASPLAWDQDFDEKLADAAAQVQEAGPTSGQYRCKLP